MTRYSVVVIRAVLEETTITLQAEDEADARLQACQIGKDLHVDHWTRRPDSEELRVTPNRVTVIE